MVLDSEYIQKIIKQDMNFRRENSNLFPVFTLTHTLKKNNNQPLDFFSSVTTLILFYR